MLAARSRPTRWRNRRAFRIRPRTRTGDEPAAAPTYRPRDQFWPYADLEEEPSDEELARLDPDLQDALFEQPARSAVLVHARVRAVRRPRLRQVGGSGPREQRLPRSRHGRAACGTVPVSRRTRCWRCAICGRSSDGSTRARCSSTTGRCRTRASSGCRSSGICFHASGPRIRHSNTTCSKLEADLRKLEAEYNMFFAGQLPRPPWETRTRVEQSVKRLDATAPISGTYAERFRLQTLQSRFATFVELWDRGLRAREEGRPGPFARRAMSAPRPTAGAPRRPGRLRHRLRRSHRDEMDKLQRALRAPHRRPPGARRVRRCRSTSSPGSSATRSPCFKKRGAPEVAFRVAVHDGKDHVHRPRPQGLACRLTDGRSDRSVVPWEIGRREESRGGRGRPGDRQKRRLDLDDVAGLRALGAVDDLELDRLAFLERPEPVALIAE